MDSEYYREMEYLGVEDEDANEIIEVPEEPPAEPVIAVSAVLQAIERAVEHANEDAWEGHYRSPSSVGDAIRAAVVALYDETTL